MMFENVPYFDWVKAGVILLAAIILAKIIYWVMLKYVRRATEKTQSRLDDQLFEAVKWPFYVGIILLGIYLAIIQILLAAPYLIYIKKAFLVIAIIWATLLVKKVLGIIISWGMARFAKKRAQQKTVNVLKRLVNIFVYFIAILIALDLFGIEITPLIASLGIAGLAVALALQDTLANFFSGLYMIADQPVRVGDFIETEGISGYVEEIGWRSTKIRTLPNNLVIIPNSKLANNVITNYYYPFEEMGVVIPVGVGYNENLEKVEKMTVDVARQIQKKVPGAVKKFEPFIRYNEFGDSNINFSVILRVETFVDKYLITHEFIKALKKRYDKEKIEISWPVSKVYLHKGRGK